CGVAVSVVMGGQIGLIVLACASRFRVVEEFYRDLASARGGERSSSRSEYVTSYRHLREHGNAVSIVILELVLAFVILRSPSEQAALSIIFVWLVPGVFAWFVGTALESRMVSRPLAADSTSDPERT